MKLLTATHLRQGEQAGDFCHAIEGELVLLGFVCATDEEDPDGVLSANLAVLQQLPQPPDDFRRAIAFAEHVVDDLLQRRDRAVAGGEQGARRFGVATHGAQRLLQFVRERRGQLSGRRASIQLRQRRDVRSQGLHASP